MLKLIFYHNTKNDIFTHMYQYIGHKNTCSHLQNKINCRNYFCESFEKKQKELEELKKINTPDKEKLYLIELLKKIELQNQIMSYHIQKINDNITTIKKINEIKKN